MRVPQPDIIEHFGNADAVPQPSERCLSRKAGIVRCCLYSRRIASAFVKYPHMQQIAKAGGSVFWAATGVLSCCFT